MGRGVKLALFAVSAAVAAAARPGTAAAQQQSRPTRWGVGGTDTAAYAVTTSGSVIDSAGATVIVRATTARASDFSSLGAAVRADTLHRRHVTLSADIETRAVERGAFLWMRVDTATQTLVLANGELNPVRGTSTPTHAELTVFVPEAATIVAFGVYLAGAGEADAHNVRFVVGPATSSDAPIPDEPRRVLDSAIVIARGHSLWRDTVSWSAVIPRAYALAAGATAVEDVRPALQWLLTRLGDHHSFLQTPQVARAYAAGGAENPRSVVRALGDSVGYASIPAFAGMDTVATRAYANALQDSIAVIVRTSAASCRWVLDLRDNSGGNMWPMLGGLRPFLGDASLGAFVSSGGASKVWRAGDGVDIVPTGPLAALESAYVAVLTGPRTASSGEAVAISFRGRPRTKSFGEPTGGYSTSNTNYSLPDGSVIFLTTAVEADRTGRRYGAPIDPDVVVNKSPTSTDDVALARAVEWLRAQPACR